jgi:cardiolipin synthase
MLTTGALLLVLAILFWFFPRVLVYPLVVVFVWIALASFYKGYKLYREGKQAGSAVKEDQG